MELLALWLLIVLACFWWIHRERMKLIELSALLTCSKGWIPVSERLPTEDCYVITVMRNDDGPVVLPIKYFANRKEFGTKKMRVGSVSHWQPLPAPPASL